MLKKIFAAGAVAVAICAGAAGAANAAVWTTQLDWSNQGSNGAVINPGSQGQVTLTEFNGLVDVLVELSGGLKFVDTGNAGNHFPFSFNIAPNAGQVDVVFPYPNVDITSQHCTGNPAHPTCTTSVDNAKWTFNPPPGPYNQSAFGNFDASFDCCGNGGSVNRGSKFEFTVTAPGITFLGSPNVGDGYHFFSNTGGWWFSADVVDGNGNTFLLGGRDAICQSGCAVVPEPNAWALMILGFGSAGALLRRRRTVLA